MIVVDLVTEDVANEVIAKFKQYGRKPISRLLRKSCENHAKHAGVDFYPVWRIVRREVECV